MADFSGEATKPFFSICIPAYNASRHLIDCIKSIEMQSFSDWEAIIVDDASSDNTLEIAGSRSDANPSRFLVVSLKENHGPYHARRIAITRSRGRYLLFLDSDDELIGADALATIAKCLNDSGADILAFNMADNLFNLRGLVPYSKFFNLASMDSVTRLESGDFLMGFLRTYELNNLAGKAIMRDLLANPSVDSSIRLSVAEDRLEVFTALIRAHSVAVLDEPLYYYRPNESSTTHGELTVLYCQQQAFVEQTIFAKLKEMNLDYAGQLSNYVCILTYELRQLCSKCSGGEAHERLRELGQSAFCREACRLWLKLPHDRRSGGIDVYVRAKLFAMGCYRTESFICRAINLLAASAMPKKCS